MNDGTQTPECGQINSSVVKSSNENPREQYTFPLTAVVSVKDKIIKIHPTYDCHQDHINTMAVKKIDDTEGSVVDKRSENQVCAY